MRRVLCLFLVPIMLSAQESQRYSLVTVGPGSRGSAMMSGGVPTPTTTSRRQTEALVTIASRDSGAMKIWEVTVDSARSAETVVNLLNPGRSGASSDGLVATGRPAVVNRVIFKNERPFSNAVVGRPDSLTVRLDSISPSVHLLKSFAGLSLLLPNRSLPAKVGEVRADTLIQHNTVAPRTLVSLSSRGSSTANTIVPGYEVFDTTIVTWKRVAADSVKGSSIEHSWQQLEKGYRKTFTAGSYLILFDSNNMIRAAAAHTQAQGITSDGKPTTIMVQPIDYAYSLTRIR